MRVISRLEEHALANSLAAGLYGASLIARSRRAGRGLRLAGLTAAGLGGILGADGSVARGPATAPQPTFRARVAGGAVEVCLPGAG
jgi:hypothetical protein